MSPFSLCRQRSGPLESGSPHAPIRRHTPRPVRDPVFARRRRARLRSRSRCAARATARSRRSPAEATTVIGRTIGPYQVVAKLGEGGMGEVYRARDTKLDRAVAIKILPEAFAADTERIARFQREARTLASLNHPNIAHIHGLEESDGVRALVMELVEGEDLAQRIARGAIPVAEALPIAKQMADALEAAHEQGIIHRDLKPANIKVRPDGTVKVLDFGLAKAMEPTGVASPSVSQSPTITDTRDDPGRDDPRHGRLHEPGAGARQAGGHAAPTSGRSAACSTRCSRGGGRSTGRASRKRWRVSSSVSRTGPGCRRRCRLRCARTSNVACRKIPDSECRPSATSGWRWRARSRRRFRRRPRRPLWRRGGASRSVSQRSSRAARSSARWCGSPCARLSRRRLVSRACRSRPRVPPH